MLSRPGGTEEKYSSTQEISETTKATLFEDAEVNLLIKVNTTFTC